MAKWHVWDTREPLDTAFVVTVETPDAAEQWRHPPYLVVMREMEPLTFDLAAARCPQCGRAVATFRAASATLLDGSQTVLIRGRCDAGHDWGLSPTAP